MISYLDTIFWILLGLSLLSVWIRRAPRIWGSLFTFSLLIRMIEGKLLFSGVFAILVWAALWVVYIKSKNRVFAFTLFILLIILSFGFKFHLFPGFIPTPVTQRFMMSLETPLLGLFPLALIVPLVRRFADWKKVTKEVLFGCLGIAVMAIAAVASGAVHWHCQLPSHAATRYLYNLVLVAVPEEAFYRGFVQRQIAKYFKNTKVGKGIALFITSILFTLAHIYWSPSVDILAFVFLASLLYGGVYLLSEKIESAILCHFLLNAVHMSCFSYHAM